MTPAAFVSRLSAAIPHCPYCDEPGRLRGENEAGAMFQCQATHCPIRGSWTVPTEPAPVVDTTGYSLESWRAA